MRLYLKWLALLLSVIVVSIVTLNVLIYRQPLDNKWLEANDYDASEFVAHSGTKQMIDNDELTAKHDANLGVRMRGFCNLPFYSVHGAEGNVSKRAYKLEAVFVVTRHGHRAPIFSPRDVDAHKRTKVQCDLSDSAIREIHYLPLERFGQRIQGELRDTLKRIRELNVHRAAGPLPTDAELLSSVYNDAYYAGTWKFFNLRGASCASGQLSLFGIMQFLELGRYFRRVYIDRWNLVPKALRNAALSRANVSATNGTVQGQAASNSTEGGAATKLPSWSPFHEDNYYHVTLKTTSAQRTHLSGIALMFALLDLDHYHPNEVRTRLNVRDADTYSRMMLPFLIKRVNFMNFCDEPTQRWLPAGGSCTCPGISPLAKALYQRASRFQNSTPAVRDARVALFDFVPPRERATGPLWLLDLIDYFVPDACFALQLPCANVTKGQQTEQRCMNSAQLEALLAASEMLGHEMSNLAMQKHYSSVFIYPLLSEIAMRMRSLVANSTNATDAGTAEELTRFTLYSGHDYTVLDLMRALGVHRGGWPKYAARVVFELYSTVPSQKQKQKPTSTDEQHEPLLTDRQYFVRLLVNGADVTHELEPCLDHTDSGGLCAFDAFQRFVLTDLIFKNTHANSFSEACRFAPFRFGPNAKFNK